jgi:hypothetical protein
MVCICKSIMGMIRLYDDAATGLNDSLCDSPQVE